MSEETKISVEEWHELEALRVRTLNRLGMSSAASRAYANCDLDMLRALDALLDQYSSTTHAENICKAVVRLREAHGTNEVASLITEDHVRLGATIHDLMLTSTLMRGGRYEARVQKALDDVLVFVYQNMSLKEQVKAALRLNVTDPAEVISMSLAAAGSAPALIQGTL
jgi:predicted RNA-binding Zn ribbon-like protein